ncbi:hypothetical protein POM88_007614 [Heracleum sosnowskyi]|uniref:Uncharacterized protein n=1 Tax=Heracleum sosnowskyi TaxID=360622 RepID=A0AAD8J7V2_9APIA|nr:hypothetical protein POM88_007614 [Heracleum sosnowskyi]
MVPPVSIKPGELDFSSLSEEEVLARQKEIEEEQIRISKSFSRFELNGCFFSLGHLELVNSCVITCLYFCMERGIDVAEYMRQQETLHIHHGIQGDAADGKGVICKSDVDVVIHHGIQGDAADGEDVICKSVCSLYLMRLSNN